LLTILNAIIFSKSTWKETLAAPKSMNTP